MIRADADNSASSPAAHLLRRSDLSRFAIALLNDGKLDGKLVLDPDVIRLISDSHTTIPGGRAQYGYGLMRGECARFRPEHGGSMSGYGSHVRFLPNENAAMIFLVNARRPAVALDRQGDGLLAKLRPDERPIEREETADAELQATAGKYVLRTQSN